MGLKLWDYTTGSADLFKSGSGEWYSLCGKCWDYKVYALNAVSGAEVWNYTTGGQVYSSPAVANGVVYVGSDDKKVVCVSCRERYKNSGNYTTGTDILSSPAVANGVVYFGS